jgi:phage baseplate assembly protein W
MAKQFYGITYPFSDDSDLNTLCDMNETRLESIKSMVLHIIFTSKGQRIRQPEFGTDLIKYIFEPDGGITLGNVKDEIRRQISFYLPEVSFNNIKINNGSEIGQDNTIFVEVDYSVKSNGSVSNHNVTVKI